MGMYQLKILLPVYIIFDAPRGNSKVNIIIFIQNLCHYHIMGRNRTLPVIYIFLFFIKSNALFLILFENHKGNA